jgi:hypothetical protein
MTDLEIMTSELKEIIQKCEELLIKKNHDYSGDKNGFSNFERTAAIAKIKPEITFLVQIANKVARLSELLMDDKLPKNESIKDSIADGINYFVLLSAYLKKKELGKTSVKDGFLSNLTN